MLCCLLFVMAIVQLLICISDHNTSKDSLLKADVFAPAILAITTVSTMLLILFRCLYAYVIKKNFTLLIIIIKHLYCAASQPKQITLSGLNNNNNEMTLKKTTG